MANVEKALALSEQGMYCFPVNHTADNEKKPYTPNGHLDATLDPNVLMDWWAKWPNAQVGVACGKSGIAVADVDTKNGKDGWASLDEAWLDLGSPFSYETGTGGSHLVYLSPEGLNLNGQSNYRGLVGVDRRAGSSWVMWTGDVPDRADLQPAPEWLLDEAKERSVQGFEGTVKDWYDSLTPGEPNVMVRRAIKAIQDDMGHSDMVSATYEAIRLGSEGNPGVPDLVEALEEAWMNRPAENHTTPESAWEYKFQEALLGGLEKYGQTTELFKNLPEYNIAMVPASIPDALVTSPGAKADFSKLLGALVKETDDDDRILSILWNCNGTKKWAREWGLEFSLKRIQDARHTPEPTRENPAIEEKREAEAKGKPTTFDLLTEDEREYLKTRPTFVDRVESVARGMGYEQGAYFRAIGWMMASMRYGMKGYVPVSDTQRHGLNLWNIIMGYSGTGKSVTDDFRDQVLDQIFDGDNQDGGVGYDLGTDSSPQGLHMALLERDGKASLFSADEASGWFKTLGKRDWDSGLEDILSDWYMGKVSPSNKVNLKELRGKSARTSFSLQMFATPDRLAETLTRDQFKSGFLARVMWSFGEPKKESDAMFDIFKDSADRVTDVEIVPEVIQDIIADLNASVAWIDKPLVLKPTAEAAARMGEAYKAMYRMAEGRENWDIIEPAITRHMEALLKCSGIAAMYREDTKIELVDALHAIKAVEEWYKNLFRVADLISAGQFQRRATEIENWIIERGGTVTKPQLTRRFRNYIDKDMREIESILTYLVESGTINRDESGGRIKYELNGRA